MNIVFAGTPEFGLPSLEAIVQSKHALSGVYTQPDRPAGRGHKLQPSAIKVWAETHGFPVYQPFNFKTKESIDEFAALKADLLVVIAYGLILPRVILELPRYGCINVHASLLPRWRGASPIQQAILHNDPVTGVSIMQMDVGMDTGPVYQSLACPIDAHETTGSLHHKLSMLAPPPLLDVIDAIETTNLLPIPQVDELATHAPKISKDDALIQWSKPAIEIDCQIRAFNPWPIAYTHAGNEIIRIHQARILEEKSHHAPGTILAIHKEGIHLATGDQVLLVERLQFPGGKALSVSDWLNAGRDNLYVNLVLQ